jgi:hypothetical protein
MSAHDIGCCQRPPKRRGWTAGGVIFAVLAALMPKCPMCIAAWLCVLGLSGLGARIDPRILWLAAAVAIAIASARLVHAFSTGRTGA